MANVQLYRLLREGIEAIKSLGDLKTLETSIQAAYKLSEEEETKLYTARELIKESVIVNRLMDEQRAEVARMTLDQDIREEKLKALANVQRLRGEELDAKKYDLDKRSEDLVAAGTDLKSREDDLKQGLKALADLQEEFSKQQSLLDKSNEDLMEKWEEVRAYEQKLKEHAAKFKEMP